MSRDKKLTAEERRQQIIEKAAEVFSLHGVEGTRTRNIAAACEINEALLYRHFSGKEELYREAMAAAYDKVLGKWREAALKQSNGLDVLTTLIHEMLQGLSENPQLSANVWHGVASSIHDPVMRNLTLGRFNLQHKFIFDLIKKGQADGSIRADIDPKIVTSFFRGIVWLFILRAVLHDHNEDNATPDTICNSLRDYLGTGNPVKTVK